jgi:hypothetical protein
MDSSRAFFMKGNKGFFAGPSVVAQPGNNNAAATAPRAVKRVRQRGFLTLLNKILVLIVSVGLGRYGVIWEE